IKGRDMLISNGSAICVAYDPANGREIWSVTGGAESTVSMPFTEDGIVYWYTGPVLGGDSPTYNEILAVNPVGTGDITGTNIIWRKQFPQSTNQMLTPVLKDGLIYTADTRHKMMCLDAKNGDQVWSTNVKSNFNASPLFIDGNIWFFSVRGEVLVLKAGRTHELINTNQLDSGIWATPAVLRNSIIVRTEKYLYRISN
ncbi:MAG: PQQ-like beta-propeller repeat protein, partial [Bacteroidales bacterium]|nr:PQQ-like beta-propeller repeat protein [Bacteroidales bacterium]